jgi:hypothetical protein
MRAAADDQIRDLVRWPGLDLLVTRRFRGLGPRPAAGVPALFARLAPARRLP